MMLVATGMDADNRLMHVATGICDKENADNYSWFYRMMKNNAEMAKVLNSPKTTLFTDKHLSHEPAIRVHASKPVWRWCLRHVIRRLPEAPGSIVTGFLYHAARAPTLKKFMDIMDSNVKPFKPKVYDALVAPADKHGNPSKQQSELVKWTHHAGPPDTAIGSVVSSNAAEQNMAMVGLEGRKLPPFGMMEYILDKTAAHMAERAELRDGTSEKFTPHAAKEYGAQRKKSSNLHSSATGNCNFTVRKRGSQYGNRVRLEFGGTDGGVTLMSCTCGFTTRFKIPCCDIIAVGRVLNKSDEVMASIDPAYHLDTYRALYGDSRFEVQLPVLDELTVDPDILPPRWVPNQAGRPKGKGPQSTKRIPSRGEHASSSSYNVRLTPTPSTRAPALSQGAPAASQGAATLSQGAPVLSQGAPAPSQGGVQSSVVSID
ncbi:unnamed protein product [Ectocarpus sp. CCAP 1310/34]|nr:unnamed protein product [Ectocarpus sp. CCAP 1310/34]